MTTGEGVMHQRMNQGAERKVVVGDAQCVEDEKAEK